jgi:glycyl-tRNA synthetase beta chain
MAEFFIEIGSEEIPSGYVEPALRYMKKELSSFFSKNRIDAEVPKTMGTPRRMIVSIKGVMEMQEDSVDEFLGPGVSLAYDDRGQPTKAAIGFARGKGIDVADLTRKQTPKGEVICAKVELKGRSTPSLLNEYLPQLINEIPFQKKMRWENKTRPFARPLHWVAALFDGNALEFEFDGIVSGMVSRGHRFLNPEKFKIKSLESYLDECKKHSLIVDPEIRKKSILEQVQQLAKQAGGCIKEDEDLVNLVNYLVEYPVAIKGDFDTRFLELPQELLVITMKSHQKYFPIWDKKEKLLPCFITISNMPATNENEIQKGNERVLRARLEDARFFYDEDRKKNLEDFVESLKGVVFQKQLGTIYEKVGRITALAGTLTSQICPKKETQVSRAARLSKADLVSQMVFEFPELQGIMGGYYAMQLWKLENHLAD